MIWVVCMSVGAVIWALGVVHAVNVLFDIRRDVREDRQALRRIESILATDRKTKKES